MSGAQTTPQTTSLHEGLLWVNTSLRAAMQACEQVHVPAPTARPSGTPASASPCLRALSTGLNYELEQNRSSSYAVRHLQGLCKLVKQLCCQATARLCALCFAECKSGLSVSTMDASGVVYDKTTKSPREHADQTVPQIIIPFVTSH